MLQILSMGHPAHYTESDATRKENRTSLNASTVNHAPAWVGHKRCTPFLQSTLRQPPSMGGLDCVALPTSGPDHGLSRSFKPNVPSLRQELKQTCSLTMNYLQLCSPSSSPTLRDNQSWLAISTMPRTRSRSSSSLDRSKGQDSAFSASTPPYDPAALILADETSSQPEEHAVTQNPATYYKALSHLNMPPSSSTDTLAQDGHGYVCRPEKIGAYGGQVDGPVQQGRTQVLPYSLTARPINRPTTVPLATITEQGSYSTLNSHCSHLSTSHFPSRRVAKTVSSNRPTYTPPWSMEENTRHGLQEGVLQDDLCVMADASGKLPHEYCRRMHSETDSSTPPASISLQRSLQRPQESDTKHGDTGHNMEGRESRGLICGVLQSVRAASHGRSRSSSIAHTSIESRDDQTETNENRSQNRLQISETIQKSNDKLYTPYLMQAFPLSATLAPQSDSQARNRKISTANHEFSACHSPTLTTPLRSKSKIEPGFGSISHLLPPLVATRPRERSTFLGFAQPKPRDAAHDDGMTGAQAPSNERRHDTSALYIFNGVSVHRSDRPLLTEHEHARESSRNTSFCSTMSTSYSGSVLGVDLDLCREFSHPARSSLSPTPVTPEWSTQQMTELERQDSFAESLGLKDARATESTCPLISSSTLSFLLPITAASDIVSPSYNTPKISLYSPSGKFIQPETSSGPVKDTSDCGSTPSIIASNSNKNHTSAHNILSARTCLTTARISLVPLATPTRPSAPLPAHLRHHKNYGHCEGPQIQCLKSAIVPSYAVKGCGGVVENNVLTSRTIIERSHMPSEYSLPYKGQLIRSLIRDLRNEKIPQKARVTTPATPSSSHQKKNLKKLHMFNYGTPATYVCTRASECRKSILNASTADKRSRRTHQLKIEHNPGCLGPLAGHALRICFCQPYDGAGQKTRVDAICDCCMESSSNTSLMNRESEQLREKGISEMDPTRVVMARKVDHVNKEKAVARKPRIRYTTDT